MIASHGKVLARYGPQRFFRSTTGPRLDRKPKSPRDSLLPQKLSPDLETQELSEKRRNGVPDLTDLLSSWT